MRLGGRWQREKMGGFGLLTSWSGAAVEVVNQWGEGKMAVVNPWGGGRESMGEAI